MSQNVSASTEKPKAAPYQPLYAERGIRSSMLEGWKLFALHAADFLKALGWQSLLAVSLGMAAVAFLVLPYLTECLAPWHVYTKSARPARPASCCPRSLLCFASSAHCSSPPPATAFRVPPAHDCCAIMPNTPHWHISARTFSALL